MKHLVLAAEREAQMVSAFARLIIISIAFVIFVAAGGIELPVAPVVLTYLLSYAVVSMASAVFALKRFFIPWVSLVFTAIDGISLALLIGFALRITGSPLAFHGAIPGFVFIFSILILATMRYTVGPTLVAFISFAGTWAVFSLVIETGIESGAFKAATATDPNFFFGTVQNVARWGFLAIATSLSLLAVVRRRKTLEAAIVAANKTANLSRYLPDRVASVVADQGIDALASGQQQNATVLFVDIRGFTGLSEQLTPAELGAFLSEFRSIVSREVDAHRGIVDKFIGDAVMCVFGVPDRQSGSERSGLLCAIAIRERIATLNTERRVRGQPDIEVTIGVHCGDVFAGAVGTPDRMEFTVLGDTVNIAARLQEAAKKTDAGLVVSQRLLDRAGQPSVDPKAWTPMSTGSIRGRKGTVALSEYIGVSEV